MFIDSRIMSGTMIKVFQKLKFFFYVYTVTLEKFNFGQNFLKWLKRLYQR